MNNYPDSTWAGDPQAPWNTTEVETRCDTCDYTDTFDAPGDPCINCDGTMQEIETPEQEWEEL